eukprot:5168099-Alexandrium_andersonii.AAC.1
MHSSSTILWGRGNHSGTVWVCRTECADYPMDGVRRPVLEDGQAALCHGVGCPPVRNCDEGAYGGREVIQGK